MESLDSDDDSDSTEPRFCPHCGHNENNPAARYCPYCGTRLQRSQPQGWINTFFTGDEDNVVQ